jgi:hypothetical protein
LIEQATLMTEALNRIGADHMTEEELTRIGNTAAAAVEKMKAMGIEVPPQMLKAAEAAKTVGTEHTNLIGILTSVAGAFGIAFSVSAAVNFIRTIGEEAVELRNLSLQTRINIEDLQVLAGATNDFGVTGQELGAALYNLQRRIAGNDQSVAYAYHLMGMSIDEVKDKDPMTLFLMTERGLASLKGGIQDTAAADLFGGKLGSSMIAFSAGADDAVEHAKNFNKIVGTDSVKATADFAQAIEQAWKNIKSSTTDVLGPLAEGFNNLNKLVEGGTSKWAIFWAQFKDQIAFEATGKGTENMTRLFLALQEQQDKNKKTQEEHTGAVKAGTVALDEHGRAAAFMAKLEQDSAKPLLDWQKDYLDHLKDIGQLNAQNASAIGVNADQLENYKATVERLKQEEQDRATKNKEFDQELMNGLNNQLAVMRQVEAAQAQHFGLETQIEMLRNLAAAEHLRALAVADEMTSEKDRQKVLEDDFKRQTEFKLQEAALEQALANQHGEAMVRAIGFQTQYNALYGRDAQGNLLGVNNLLDDQRKRIDAINAALPDAAKGTAEYTEKMNALQLADAKFAQELEKEAQANTKAAAAADIFGQKIAALKDVLPPGAEQTARIALATQDYVKSLEALAPAQDATQAAFDKADAQFFNHVNALKQYRDQVKLLLDAYAMGPDVMERIREAQDKFIKTINEQTQATTASANAWAKNYDEFLRYNQALGISTKTVENSIAVWEQQTKNLNQYQGQLAIVADTAEDAYNQVLKFNATVAMGPNTGQSGGQSNVSGINAQVANMATVYQWATSVLQNWGQSPTGTAGLKLPARAEGGPVESGSAYMVGEKGPEVFVPSVSGSINPNAPGGGTVIHMPITFHLVDTESNLARRVSAEILRSVKRGTLIGSV